MGSAVRRGRKQCVGTERKRQNESLGGDMIARKSVKTIRNSHRKHINNVSVKWLALKL